MILLEFHQDFWYQKTRVPELLTVRRCLRDPAFSYFGTMSAYDVPT